MSVIDVRAVPVLVVGRGSNLLVADRGYERPERRPKNWEVFRGQESALGYVWLELGRRAESEGADLVLFPELAVCGYPPRDLVERRAFIAGSQAAAAPAQSGK